MTDARATPHTDETDVDFTRLPVFDTDVVSPEIIGRTRKNNAVILQRLHELGAGEVARSMGIHDSALSRWKTGGALMFVCRLLACLGLKIVPASAIVYLQPEEFQ